MRAEDLKGWLAAARRGEKERETNTKDGGNMGGEQECQTEAEGHWRRVLEIRLYIFSSTAFRGGTRRQSTAPHHPLELRSSG